MRKLRSKIDDAFGSDSDSRPPTPRSDSQRGSAKGVVKTSLQIAALAAQGLPTQVPKAIIESLLEVVNGVEATIDNASTEKEILQRIGSLSEHLQEPLKELETLDLSPELIASVGELVQLLGEISRDCEKPKRSKFIRFVQRDEDTSDLKRIAERLRDALQEFQVNSLVRQEQAIHTLGRNLDIMELGQHRVERRQDIMKENLDEARVIGLLDRLNPARQAMYDSIAADAVAICMKGTRDKILFDIMAWVKDESQDVRHICWLMGMAGVGKSTIAKTIAQLARNLELLGATFVFSRRAADAALRDPTKVIPTLIYQLSQFCSNYRSAISEAVARSPDVAHKGIQGQADVLLDGLLRTLPTPRATPLIILDAFDECEGEGAELLLRLILSAVFSGATPFPPIKIFITSRPETYIQQTFKEHVSSSRIIFHDIETVFNEADVRLFLDTMMRSIPRKLFIDQPSDWYTQAELQALVQRSGKLFIYAATAIRYIEADPPVDPRAQLGDLLANTDAPANFLSDLDDLYKEILRKVSTAKLSFKIQFQRLLGAIILLRTSIPLSSIERLLAFPARTGRSRLRAIHSVIVIPADDSECVTMYHPSFSEFILDPTRCTDLDIFVDERTHETSLAAHCLQLLVDYCVSLASSSIELVLDALPFELRYAARYWASHLLKAFKDDSDLFQLLDQFAYKHILRWLEILSLLGSAHDGVRSLAWACLWATQSDCSPELLNLLRETRIFVSTFIEAIKVGPSHVYTSALAFCPRETLFWKIYGSDRAFSFKVLQGIDLVWSPRIGVWEGHRAAVYCVAFSPNGVKVASGSLDNTVRLWDTVSGDCVVVLRGHAGFVCSVAFSPDGSTLASGSADRTIRIWTAATGYCRNILNDHTGQVTHVAYSTDGLRLASSSKDHTVRLWDVAHGDCLLTFEGHQAWVSGVSFSPDGSKLASSSHDRSVKIWRAATGECLACLTGHGDIVHFVTFSPDGSRLISASNNNTIWVWDPNTSICIAVWEGHSGWAYNVSFCADGSKLASASTDQTIRIWDTATGSCVATLPNGEHLNPTVAFSPDGSQIVSGAGANGIVQLWDTMSSVSATCQAPSHSRSVTNLDVSLDGSKLASWSNDKTIRIWDTKCGDCLAVFQGPFIAISFSTGGAKLLSGSKDWIVRIWDIATGDCLHSIHGHTGSIRAVAWSRDDVKVASGSEDGTIRVWDVDSLECTHILSAHTHPVTSVAFSLDSAQLVSLASDVTMQVWDLEMGACIRVWPLGTSSKSPPIPRRLAFCRDSSKVFSGSGDVWSVETGQPLPRLTLDECDEENALSHTDSTTQNSPLRRHSRFLRADFVSWLSVQTRSDGLWHRVCRLPKVDAESSVSSTLVWGDIVALGSAKGRVFIMDMRAWEPSTEGTDSPYTLRTTDKTLSQ